MLEKTVLAKARPEDVRTDPFPHLVIEDALDADVFAELLRTRPPYSGDSEASNRRVSTPAWVAITTEAFDPAWRVFSALHSQPAITRRMWELFDGHLADSLPTLPNDDRFGVLGMDDWAAADVLCDARLDTISPARSAGSHRKAHLDTPNRFFSALLYFRSPDDCSSGGGLDLFRWTDGPKAPLDAFEFAESTVERVLTVPYKANTLVAFPNSVHAIHGSQIRQPTDHDRAYVFITAEVEKDLF